VREGVLRRHFRLPDGHVRDTVYYSILADEWPAVKARLEERLNQP
jgi:RimJ/RimL family protein N-acetyltransferase